MINIIPVFTVKYNTGIISSTFRSLGPVDRNAPFDLSPSCSSSLFIPHNSNRNTRDIDHTVDLILLGSIMIGQKQQDTFLQDTMTLLKVQPMIDDLQNLVDKIRWTRPKRPDLSYYPRL
jgi:hypothetical protein